MFVSYVFGLTILFGVALTILFGIALIGFSLMLDDKKPETEF